MKRRSVLGIVAAGVLTGCSFAPPYTVPKSAPAPQQYKESTGWIIAQPGDELPKGDWWTVFGDTQLNALEAQAGSANQNLKAAFARLQQARADTRIARADLFPTVDSTAYATKGRVSPNSPSYIQGKPTEGTDFNLEADLSYEVDLWGRVRNEVSAARATEQASAADLASVRLSVQAELASDYFSVRGYDTQQQLLDRTVEAYQKSLDLTQRQLNGGAVPLSDVAQATTQLRSAQTQAADTHLMRAQMEHAIAVLIGENPSTYQFPVQPLLLTVAPPRIAPGLPSELLQRRPDIAQAERQVAAANAQIGVARAAYFPQFVLAGQGGFNSVNAGDWISAPSLFWSIGPHITLPIFEGGRLVAQTAKAKALYAEQVALYRNAVLTAYQDVENNLIALRQLEQESLSQSQAVEAANTALRLSLDRYDAGIVTYLEVATQQTNALQAQQAAITILTRRINAAVLLVKALGGGWGDGA